MFFSNRRNFVVIGIFVSGMLVAGSAAANCIDVAKPLELGQCRALPETKTYIGSATSERLWTYTCDFECHTIPGSVEIVKAVHQDYESDELNALVCKGVTLDIVDVPGSVVKQCRRTAASFEIFAQGSEPFASLLVSGRSFVGDVVVRERVVAAFASELREVSVAYGLAAAAADPNVLRDTLEMVGTDLLSIASVFDVKFRASSSKDLQVLSHYLPYLRGEIAAIPGTREGFVTTHLNMHRDLILNLSRYRALILQ